MSAIGFARACLGRGLCAVLLSGGMLLGLGQAARAQFAFEDDILPPRVVAWRLAERGYSGLGRPRFDGRVYVVDAVSPAGVPVRLFVDPGVGAVVGRRPLGPPVGAPLAAPGPYARLERPAPGYGWTEDDAGSARTLRPPPIQDVPSQAARPIRRPGAEAPRPEANPYGLNPDAAGRAGSEAPRAETPRKVARAAAPARQPDLKPALRTAPEAPAPKLAPDEAEVQSPATPAAATEQAPREPPAAGAAAAKPVAETAREAVKEAAKPAARDWKDPPADRGPVRVIGGATMVPGAVGRETGAAP